MQCNAMQKAATAICTSERKNLPPSARSLLFKSLNNFNSLDPAVIRKGRLGTQLKVDGPTPNEVTEFLTVSGVVAPELTEQQDFRLLVEHLIELSALQLIDLAKLLAKQKYNSLESIKKTVIDFILNEIV